MLKGLIKILFVIFIGKSCFSQNLIQDSSFENISSCPIGGAGIILNSINWFSTTSISSPELFHTCAVISSNVNAPDNNFGYQMPRTSNAYAGIINFISNEGREYVSSKLKDTLMQENYYCFSMYVSLADSVKYASNKIGVYFSPDSLYTVTFANMLYNPQLEFTQMIVDCENWMLLEAVYQANGGEKYLTIGNFRDNLQTDTLSVKNNSVLLYSYYYIDDVSLYPCEAPPPTDSLSVTIPNVFTPNGDGQNDNFVLDIYGINNLKDIDVKIFNRWGQSVKSVKLKVENKTQSQIVLWDGRTTAAEEAPQGTYYYIFSYTTINEETFTRKGFLTLFR